MIRDKHFLGEWVRIMKQCNKKVGETKGYPSLFDVFNLGDRVKRKYKDENNKIKEYAGIVLAIDKDNIEVYWDTRDGKYRPNDMDLTFTNCSVNNVFKGDKHYSPIKKK